ncbi:MAG: hypothetical protein PF440_11730 [Thiomicrorhabdus sp.]|nr:hypothetical protein [Thiomicrorhabdus sp.]
MTYEDNKERIVYNIDFDGTLTTGESYVFLTPRDEMIQRVQKLYFSGHIIIIWSARLWSDASKLVSWLILNNVPFHGVMLGKGGSDCYVDDKAIHADDFIPKRIH